MRWIPVTEKLPEKGAHVLVACDDGTVGFAKYDTDDEDYLCWDRGFIEDDWVTAWMPLPEPYRPTEENGAKDEE